MVDNLFSRLIGFFVRVIVIIFSGITLIFITLVGTCLALIWPLLPFIALALLIKGVF
jgi:hypothetical protein